MAKALTTWHNHVLSEAPGVLPAFATQKILDALVDFCTRSLLWLDDHAAIDALADTGSYAFAPAAGSIVIKPAFVWYDGKPLEPKNKDELAARYQKWTTEVGQPIYYLSTVPDKLRIVPAPAEALVGGITLMCHFKPSRSATEVPDWLYEDYQEAITAGALARLKAMAQKPYSDPKGAQDCQGFFDDQVAIGKERALKALGRARPKVTPQFF